MPSGYSGTPLLKKLGIKSGMRLLWISPPPHYSTLLGDLPEGVRFLEPNEEELADFIHVFMLEKTPLAEELSRLKLRLDKNGMIWISWPKQRSSIATDLNREIIREHGLATGLVDIKVCAVDEDWSGLKFVFRKHDR